jgi:hypothetical protein
MEDHAKNTDDQSTPKGKEAFEVPPGGNLGLLALGAVGIRAWRKARAEWEAKNPTPEGKTND